MKRYLAIIVLLFATAFAKAQIIDTTTKADKFGVYSKADQYPEFPGGIEKFYMFLGKSLRYPTEARQKNIQGKVFLNFVVETDGSLSNFKILRTPSDDLAEESLRAFKLSPKWTPGKYKGEIVRVYYTVPISFTLGRQ